MQLKSARTNIELLPVLKDKLELKEEIIYWVYSEISTGKWENMTFITASKLGAEYPKTFGHYHSVTVNETSKLVHGDGIYQIQKRHYERGVWIPNMVDAVYFVKANIGDEIVTTPEYAHSWSNLGDLPLVTIDDWRSGHTSHDYENIEALHGMAYYVVIKNGELDLVPNPNYKNLPPPKILTAENFAHLMQKEKA